MGGRVRTGLLHRSSAPVGAPAAALEGIRPRVVFDLRSPSEIRLAPDVLPDGVAYLSMDVLADASPPTAAELDRLTVDPAAAREVLGTSSAAEASERRFRELVSAKSARRGYGDLFRQLADDTSHPALIHCSTGKDRTGWAVAALLWLLGVPREYIMVDFMVSAELLEPILEPARVVFVRNGGDAESFESLAGVRAQNLEAAFVEMIDQHGSVDAYFERGLGLDAATCQALRDLFVERVRS